jgi:Tol biopolymer transport system component/DNA-binding winged helix-turn-helix (wHTH) protein
LHCNVLRYHPKTVRVRFHQWELDLDGGELAREGKNVRLPPQPAKVLALLAKRAGTLVLREEIQRELWHHESQVDFDQGLNYCIRQIRVALNDNAEQPTYIETVPRRGYRFCAPVSPVVPIGDRKQDPPEAPPAKRRTVRLAWIVPFGAVALAILATAFVLQITSNRPSISNYLEITHDGMDKRGKSLAGTDAPLAADGSRIYFTEGSNDQSALMQVSTQGGETVPIKVPFDFPELLDFSAARSELLVAEHSDRIPEPPLWVVPVPAGVPHRLGELMAHDACWSPNGRQVAFIHGSELYSASADGSNQRKLAALPGVGRFPRWSPDGKWLRLTIVEPKTSNQSLWEVAADGTSLGPLLSQWNSPHAECCGNWTADGKQFMFQATREGKTEIWCIPGTRGFLSLMKLLNAPVQITSGQMNSLVSVPSPDGKKLYVIGQKLRGELMRYDVASRQFMPYLGGISADFADISRDGQWMLYVDFPNGTLWRSKVDGTQRLQLTFPPMEVMVPHWSPDGKRIVFFAIGADRAMRIYIVSADGGTPQPASRTGGSEMSPSWSPDGNSLLFSDFPFFGGDPAKVAIHILDLRSGKLSTVPGSQGIFSPRWSPDGRYIAASPPGENGIMIFDFQTRSWQRVADGFGFMNFSRDSRYLYYRRHEPQPAILRIRLDSHAIDLVADLSGIREGGRLAGLQFALTPDDSPMLLRDTGMQEIYSLDLASRARR